MISSGLGDDVRNWSICVDGHVDQVGHRSEAGLPALVQPLLRLRQVARHLRQASQVVARLLRVGHDDHAQVRQEDGRRGDREGGNGVVEGPDRLQRVRVVEQGEDHVERDPLLLAEGVDVDRTRILAQGGAQAGLLLLVLGGEVGEAVVEVAVPQQGGLERLRLQHQLEGAVGERFHDGGGCVSAGHGGNARAGGAYRVRMPVPAVPGPPLPARPDDDDVVAMTTCLRWQHQYVSRAGSPTAALVLEAIARDLESGGPLTAIVPATARFGSLPGLRLMATVHLLALERRAPRVALHLPTLGGAAPDGAQEAESFRRAVVACLMEHPEQVAAGLARTPQTNETGRAALLRCALAHEDPARPVRLREIGCSAGLNLRADHLPGLPGLEPGPLPPMLDRVGCDLDPVDPLTPEGRALLTSYVWVDDVDRYERLRRALAIAAAVPAEVLAMDAADFCASLDVQEGTTTVLWHSAMWLYLPRTTQAKVTAAIAAVGDRARPSAPFVHASWEWDADTGDDSGFMLVVRRWDGDRSRGDRAPLRPA